MILALRPFWIDKVFTQGWAYGKGSVALRDKSLLWAVTTGGEHNHFQIGDHPGLSVLAQPLHATVFLGQGSEFAFVVFGAATVAGLLTDQWGKSLTLAVALSMGLTPLLILLLDRLESAAKKDSQEPDIIDQQNPLVIIAGFGRFGQIAGRLLMSCGVEVVVLDHDPDHIETLRKFGVKVFYGDATRLDLLEAAGAAQAVVLINALTRC